MRDKALLLLTLTTIVVIGLLQGCKNSQKSDISETKKVYETARLAGDYNTAVFALTSIVSKDSANNSWAYDSLAFYHYFYLSNPNVMPNLKAVEFYADKGIQLNKENFFLQELKAKAILQLEKDTLAYQTFEQLWQKTHDYTYLWDMTFIEIGRGNARRADSLIKTAINSPDSISKTVRMEVIQARIMENVPVKAAFMYMQATMLLQRNQDLISNVTAARPIMFETLRIYPNFYSMKQLMYQVDQRLSGATR